MPSRTQPFKCLQSHKYHLINEHRLSFGKSNKVKYVRALIPEIIGYICLGCIKKGMILYRAVSSPLDRSMRFTFHPLHHIRLS